jgi:hypothetical protein
MTENVIDILGKCILGKYIIGNHTISVISTCYVKHVHACTPCHIGYIYEGHPPCWVCGVSLSLCSILHGIKDRVINQISGFCFRSSLLSTFPRRLNSDAAVHSSPGGAPHHLADMSVTADGSAAAAP